MHLCYLDDSGDARHGTTVTALIIDEHEWTATLGAWLRGRRKVHRDFGVLPKCEIHANKLYKGRGSYCGTTAEDMAFGRGERDATGRILLGALAEARLTVVTVGSATVSKQLAYARTLAWLEGWAAKNATRLLLFYDGPQGLGSSHEIVTAGEMRTRWTSAVREASPFRDAHRALDLHDRRILEDPVMLDSRFSQLIQAADLVAYGAYHCHKRNHPEIWGRRSAAMTPAIVAYSRLFRHWPTATDSGMVWLDD